MQMSFNLICKTPGILILIWHERWGLTTRPSTNEAVHIEPSSLHEEIDTIWSIAGIGQYWDAIIQGILSVDVVGFFSRRVDRH